MQRVINRTRPARVRWRSTAKTARRRTRVDDGLRSRGAECETRRCRRVKFLIQHPVANDGLDIVRDHREQKSDALDMVERIPDSDIIVRPAIMSMVDPGTEIRLGPQRDEVTIV